MYGWRWGGKIRLSNRKVSVGVIVMGALYI